MSAPPLPGTTQHSSTLLGTTNRPRLLHPVYFSDIAMVVELFKGSFKDTPMSPRHSSALLGTTNRPRLLHPVYFSGIAMVVE